MTPTAALAIFNAEHNSYETASGFQAADTEYADNAKRIEEHSVYRPSGSVSNRTYLFTSSSLHECREWIKEQALAAVLRAVA